jgi:hypothetical protein
LCTRRGSNAASEAARSRQAYSACTSDGRDKMDEVIRWGSAIGPDQTPQHSLDCAIDFQPRLRLDLVAPQMAGILTSSSAFGNIVMDKVRENHVSPFSVKHRLCSRPPHPDEHIHAWTAISGSFVSNFAPSRNQAASPHPSRWRNRPHDRAVRPVPAVAACSRRARWMGSYRQGSIAGSKTTSQRRHVPHLQQTAYS